MDLSKLQKEAYELHEKGLSWREIGERQGVQGETARGRARSYAGTDSKTRAGPPEKRVQKREVLRAALDDHGLSEGEFKAILSSLKRKPGRKKKVQRGGKSKTIKLLVLSDTHIGHEKFDEELFARAVKASEGVDLILHPGDHLEGMSGRPGHIYELTEIGYQKQINRCRELYSRFKKPIYGIDGNHDQWFKQKNNTGAVVGEELDRTIENYNHLGEWEGDLHIDGLWIKLFHANDGSSYATSYKMQKLIESFSGGEKPHIVFSGHYHKAMYQFVRNVHGFESGTICGQSQYMRGKKLAAHMGFWIVSVNWDKTGVTEITPKFVPGYE